MMIPSSLHILPEQERKILSALRKRKGCHIKVKKKRAGGTDRMLLTPEHIKKYQKAAQGSVVSLPFQHKHLVENSHHKGGFLPLLAALLGPILGGVAGGLIGRGINLRKKKKKRKKRKTTAGQGMYLNPYHSGFKRHK